ncbi:MAG: cell division protein FtsA [Chloroflexi bacterium]|nr:cell division protein FtsA [Chloroflexota bacterium]MCH8114026.1 cell division protein FtsA [Chloroflexota bacterium]MCI0774675.1 cell division protein FtsA [Chloroflexota bacterium]MCI0802899.1 cell division protein FtsA [Chloroflexota bacterium]MCI0807865.1 cell division protein FtsA [Chloroflexota bacterium]
MQEDFRVAIDIGTTKVCTIITRRRADHRVEVAGIGVVPCSGMSKGVVANSHAVTAAIRESTAVAAADADVGITAAYVGLTGTHVESKNTWVNVPRADGMRAVTDLDLSAAKKAAGRFDLADDRKLLHVIPRSYALDGLHGVRNPLGMHTGELHVESHVITGSVSKITELHNAVSDAGVRISSMVVEPVATADAVLTADEREEGTVLIDVGGGTSDIAVYHDGTVIHTAVIPVGGFQFSNDLSIAFAIDFDSAERLKIEHGTAAPELAGMSEEITLHPTTMSQSLVVSKREVGQVVKERVSELFRMILLKLEEPHLADVSIDRIVFTGGGAKLEGFLNIAKYIFQRKVRLATPRGLDGMPEGTNDPSYSAAAGIALWGIRNLPAENHISHRKGAPVSGVSGSDAKSLNSALAMIRGWLPKREQSRESDREKETAGV